MKNLDFKRAFDFVRSGENWSQKLLIGGTFYWIMNLLNFYGEQTRHLHPGQASSSSFLILIAILLLSILPAGYLIQVTHNEINNKSDSLPHWNEFIKYLKYQLSLFLPCLAYFIPIGFAFGFINGFSFSIAKHMNNSLALLIMLGSILSLIFILLPIVGILGIMLNLSYAENLKIGNCFKPVRFIKLFKNALPEFFMYFLVSLVIHIPLFISAFLAPKNILFSIIGFISFPVGIFFAHLSAQAYKYALSKEKDLAFVPAETQIE